jgi:hypothetical protein
MSGKPKLARKATLEKMAEAGVDPAIIAKPGLTLEEANAAIREKMGERELEEIRAVLREAGHPMANSPALSLEDARDLVEQAEFDIIRKKCGPPPSREERSRVDLIPSSSDPGEVEIVGESFHTAELKKLYAALPKDDGVAHCWAVLVPEPKNRHDSNAVAVLVNGQKVGYLNRDDAEEVQGQLVELLEEDKRLLTVPATIRTGDRGLFGVRLHWELGNVPSLTEIAAEQRKASAAEIAAEIGEERRKREAEKKLKEEARRQATEEKRRKRDLAKEHRRLNPPPPLTPGEKRFWAGLAVAILAAGSVLAYWTLERLNFF